MKCPYCGGEIGNGDKCDFCGSRISYEMKRELEQLNKKGCPACGSSNVSFTREQEGETWDTGFKKYIRRTVGICHDCGHTWYTDFLNKPTGSSTKTTGNTGGGAPPKKPVPKGCLWIPAILLIMIILLGQCHDKNHEDPGTNWTTEESPVAEEETTEYERELNILTINPVDNRELKIGKAEIITHTGKIEKEDQDDIYIFIPERDGVYRLEISNLQNDGIVFIGLYDSGGQRLTSGSAENGEGLTLTGLKKNKKYMIHVSYYDGFTPYVLSIAKQKEKKDISDYSSVKDSIEFTEQDNCYSFTAPYDGTYRFEFAGIHNDLNLGMSVENDLGKRLQFSIIGNEEGLTLPLKKGIKYTLHIFESEGVSPYELIIGKQKPVADITAYDGVQDSIEFNSQVNMYSYKPSDSKVYEFYVSDLMENTTVSISVYDKLEERVAFGSCGNNDLVLGNLKAGETYTIHVEYDSGYSPYFMLIQ